MYRYSSTQKDVLGVIKLTHFVLYGRIPDTKVRLTGPDGISGLQVRLLIGGFGISGFVVSKLTCTKVFAFVRIRDHSRPTCPTKTFFYLTSKYSQLQWFANMGFPTFYQRNFYSMLPVLLFSKLNKMFFLDTLIQKWVF